MRSEGELTYSQWLWCQCQLWLDEGLQACPACQALSLGAFCPACGTALRPEPARCPQCEMPGQGRYCMQCGALLHSPITESIAAGDFDWTGWYDSLTPFLGGLTAQEQALLTKG